MTAAITLIVWAGILYLFIKGTDAAYEGKLWPVYLDLAFGCLFVLLYVSGGSWLDLLLAAAMFGFASWDNHNAAQVRFAPIEGNDLGERQDQGDRHHDDEDPGDGQHDGEQQS